MKTRALVLPKVRDWSNWRRVCPIMRILLNVTSFVFNTLPPVGDGLNVCYMYPAGPFNVRLRLRNMLHLCFQRLRAGGNNVTPRGEVDRRGLKRAAGDTL